MRFYPATITQDEKHSFTGIIQFSENHSAFGSGATEEEAIADLELMLACTAEDCFKDETYYPEPNPPKDGEMLIFMPTVLEAKILLHHERLKRKLTKAELGRMANIRPVDMQRIFDPHHNTKMETLDRLFRVLGLSFTIELR